MVVDNILKGVTVSPTNHPQYLGDSTGAHHQQNTVPCGFQSPVKHSQRPAVNTGLAAVSRGQNEGRLPSMCLLSLSFCLSLPSQVPHFLPETKTSTEVAMHWPFSIHMVAATSVSKSHQVLFLGWLQALFSLWVHRCPICESTLLLRSPDQACVSQNSECSWFYKPPGGSCSSVCTKKILDTDSQVGVYNTRTDLPLLKKSRQYMTK